MSLYAVVPGDLEPDSILDLVQDCREVTGVLGVHADPDPDPDPVPVPRGAGAVDIAPAAAFLDGYADYGS